MQITHNYRFCRWRRVLLIHSAVSDLLFHIILRLLFMKLCETDLGNTLKIRFKVLAQPISETQCIAIVAASMVLNGKSH